MNHDTQAALAIIVLSIIGLAFWAASEFQLARTRRDPLGVAKAVGVLKDRRTPATDAAFADAVEQQLRVIDGGAS